MESRQYISELKRELPAYVFKPAVGRLWWILLHYLIISISCVLIYSGDNSLLNVILAIVIGNSLAVLTFLAHEILHGTVVKNRRLIMFFSHLCLFHRSLHPKIWIAWHNRAHHNNTQKSLDDPDCFGRIQYYKYSKWLKKMQGFIPGSGSKRSYFFLFYWFTFHTFWIIFLNPNFHVDKKVRTSGKIYFLTFNAIWIYASTFFHPLGIIYFYLIPLMVSNFVHMSYIVTNHFLNPLTEEENDPLINTLTVISNPTIHFLHLNFNYHVEHHLFPGINPKYAPLINDLLQKKWPEKYKQMSHLKALKFVYKIPRFYSDDITHIHPITEEKFRNIFFEI